MIDGGPSRSIGENIGGLFEIWNTDGDQIDSLSSKDRADTDVILSPQKNGTKFRYFAIHPTPKNISREVLEKGTAIAFEKMVQLMRGLIHLDTHQCIKPKPSII